MISSRVTGFATAAIVSCVLSGCSNQSGETPQPAAQAPAAPAAGGDTTVHAVLGKAPAAVNGIPSIVILTPKIPREFPPPDKPYMDQITLTFTPPVLFVRTGHPTEFRNSDDVLHNVRVREEATREGVFNVAIPTGGSYQHTFERDGFYDIGCDIHPGMAAQVIASSSPYAMMADPDGNFFFEDVEPGAYTVAIFTGTDKIERSVDVAGPRTEVVI